jgi:heme oxygenase (biliverdin-IX-beta and delta-forming)
MIADAKLFFDKLRSATRASHQRAETLVGLPRTLHTHIQTLAIFYGFIEPWEAKIAPALAPLQGHLQGRGKAEHLIQDLKNLGVIEITRASIPRCEHLPLVDNLPAALGSMYVFEGATLGGQILSRHIEQHLGLQNGIGYSYYRSYGAGVGMMWRRYCELTIQNSADSQADAMINSARDTFQSLCDWFEIQRSA